MPTIKNPNVQPQNALNFSVEFTTTNLDNGQPFVEPFVVTGPNGSFNIPLNAVAYGGTKIFIPLTTNTSNGASYLKIWLPQPSNDKMYITFCIKASQMNDGYYDYLTGIPAAYRTDLRNWILDGANIPGVPVTYGKTLVFSAIGKDTNQSAEAIQFRVKLYGSFGNSPTSNTQTF